MKVTKTDGFQPYTITIETRDEHEGLLHLAQNRDRITMSDEYYNIRRRRHSNVVTGGLSGRQFDLLASLAKQL